MYRATLIIPLTGTVSLGLDSLYLKISLKLYHGELIAHRL